ncbi:hypothetical protein [Dictyobacter formicarum]|uniref:Uncharacterized protein n=1 Tax=Dictyobacter formicarum TaxID=2778368 RepID=A0ABQ3VSU3_9CHLR|nr:hypothetical protein [Dictyobacter formicarum]GHO88458.1 hypothetical protein KSZ_64640 [Dictyobacter formicarum]
MYLEDILSVCLQGLNSRYPKHVIDINLEIITLSDIDAKGWKAEELIKHLNKKAPHFLQKMSRMVVDSCETAIYLLDVSEETPALWLHCQGKLPPCHEHSKNAQKVGRKKIAMNL